MASKAVKIATVGMVSAALTAAAYLYLRKRNPDLVTPVTMVIGPITTMIGTILIENKD